MSKRLVLKRSTARELLQRLAQPTGEKTVRPQVLPNDQAPVSGKHIYPFQVIPDNTHVQISSERRVSVRGGLVDVILSGGDSVPSLAITQGDVTGSGSLLTDIFTVDVDIPSAASPGTTRWVYQVVNSATDAGEIAEAYALGTYMSSDATRPNETNLTNPGVSVPHVQPLAVKVLARVNNTDGKLTIDPEWTGGDWKVQPIVLDSEDPFNTGAEANFHRSLEWNSKGNAGIFGFAAINGASNFGKVPYNYYAESGGAGTGVTSHDILWGFVCKAAGLSGGSTAQVEDIITELSTSGTNLTFKRADFKVGEALGQIADGFCNFSLDGDGQQSLDLTNLIETWWSGTTYNDHGQLAGLSDNDHPIYVLWTGGEMLGALTGAGGYSLDLTSGEISGDWTFDGAIFSGANSGFAPVGYTPAQAGDGSGIIVHLPLGDGSGYVRVLLKGGVLLEEV